MPQSTTLTSRGADLTFENFWLAPSGSYSLLLQSNRVSSTVGNTCLRDLESISQPLRCDGFGVLLISPEQCHRFVVLAINRS